MTNRIKSELLNYAKRKRTAAEERAQQGQGDLTTGENESSPANRQIIHRISNLKFSRTSIKHKILKNEHYVLHLSHVCSSVDLCVCNSVSANVRE